MARLHTELVGSGRPRFAFLPGLFGRGRNWSQIAQRLAEHELASVLFDLPDHGQSAWTDHFSYLGMAEAVADDAQTAPADVATQAKADHIAQRVARAYPQLAD